ncbi:RNA polymerase sigma-70 factor [Puteibacter caeruleilacunae]|nr:RNA polymerase sigma-70 factor [Puteibacter caeruleilacunae]
MHLRSDEIALLEGVRRGDTRAFDKLYNIYSSKLYAFSLKILKSSGLAEEVVQDVFFKVWDKRNQIRTDLSFQSYLFTIAYNLIRDYYKEKHRKEQHMQQVAIEVCDSEMATGKRLNYQQIMSAIELLIKELPEKRKEIFLLSKKHGFTNAEIASELAISEQTVKNQLVSALKYIRAKINEHSINDLFLFIMTFLKGQR